MTDFIVNADVKGALRALGLLNKSIDDTAERFDRTAAASEQARDALGRFTKVPIDSSINASLGRLVKGLGAIAGPAAIGVGAITAAFVTLAAVATKTFIDITAQAVNLNKEAELTKISLTQIFEGNEKAADAFIQTVGDLAIKLGTSRQDLTGIAKGILPDVGSIEGTTELLQNVIILGRDAGAEIDDIRRTLEGALAGQFEGFGDVLNIPPPTIQKIKDLSKEIGVAAAITEVLGDRIQDQGLSIEAFADTLSTLENKIAGQFESFQILLGVAPFEELKEQAAAFLQVLDDQSENIEFVVQAFGDLAANVIDFVGAGFNEFFASLDFESIERLVDTFNGALAAGQLLIDVLFDIPETEEGIIGITIALEKTRVSLEEVAKQAEVVRKTLKATFNIAQLVFAIKGGDLAGALDAISDLGDLASLEEQEKSAKNTEAAFTRYEDRLKSISESQDKRRDTTNKATQADLDAGEATLANKKNLDELAAAQAKAADAQEEISKKNADLEEDRQKRLTNIIRKEGDKRFDDAVKSAQRREDIARKNVESIEDIFRKNEQAIAAAGTDLSREEQDIARKGARERRDIELDAANERIDIERNFRQELQRIQSQFNQDAADAERNNDAQAFLQAVRSRDDQVQVATEDRDVSVEEAGANAERQRAVLAEQLAAEVEDANIANARKLEDLQLRLNQELEAQALKVTREFEAETIKEQRLKEQRDLALQRQLEDFARTEQEKQEKLNESLAEQVALIEAAKAKEIEITAVAEAEKTAIVEAEVAKRKTALASQAAAQAQAGVGALPLAPTRGDLGAGLAFQGGGRPPVGRPVKVGEAGPEVFVPDSAGTIIPNQDLFSPPSQMSPLSAGSSTSITNNPTFNLAESMFQDPVARRNLTNFVLGVLAERV